MNDSKESGASTPECLCGGKGPALSQMMQLLMPSEAGDHFKNAGIEVLKGLRELIDQRIQTLSQKPTQGTKLNVD